MAVGFVDDMTAASDDCVKQGGEEKVGRTRASGRSERVDDEEEI